MNLKLLGLSDYEQKTYETLIQLGKSSASQISRESKVSYGKIYEVLGSLERKGLVQIIPEKSKRFIATSPERLLKIVEEKEKDMKFIKEEITKLKQVYETQEEEVIQTVKGKRNFYQVLKHMKHPKKFNYSIKYTSEYHPEWVRGDTEMIKRGVDIKILTKYDKETEKNVKKWLKVHQNIKQIDNKGVAIDIRDSEVLITLINNNTIITIKDEALVNIMKQLFQQYYKNAKKIE